MSAREGPTPGPTSKNSAHQELRPRTSAQCACPRIRSVASLSHLIPGPLNVAYQTVRVNANVIGRSAGVHTRCSRSPQKNRECDEQ